MVTLLTVLLGGVVDSEEDEWQNVVHDCHHHACHDLRDRVRRLYGELVVQWNGTVVTQTLYDSRSK